MGHIELGSCISYLVFQRYPEPHGTCLRHVPRALEEVIYFASYVVTESGDTPLDKKQLLSEKEYRAYRDRYGSTFQALWVQKQLKATTRHRFR